jgi:hypothetical protein
MVRIESKTAAGRLGAFAAAFLGALAGSCSRPSDGKRAMTSGSPQAQDGPAWFEDATDALGLDFVHDPGKPGEYFMPEILGSGAAFLDYDGDGRLDIYLLQNGSAALLSKNRLYHQAPDGRFHDVSTGSGLDVAGRGMGVAAGDVNNDGLVDVLITEYGNARLFLNLSGGKFADVTRDSGIDNPFWGTSSSFFDFDRDGWLDLVIVNYVLYSPTRPCSDQAGRRDYCGPQPFPYTAAKLFRNAGRRGRASSSGLQGSPDLATFEDVTVRSGLARSTGPGLGVFCADFTGDKWPDIFVANDGKPNFLWVNQKNGTFAEEAVLRGLALNGMGHAQANMGIAAGDLDSDGLFDLFVTHLTEERHILLKQGPRGMFLDATAAAGLANPLWPSTGFGTVFGDFDLDGDLDLAQANGRVMLTSGPSPPGTPFWEVYKERNQLFENDGSGKLRDISPQTPALCGSPAISRALACGDFDGDGALDLLVTRIGERALLLRNTAPRKGSWLMVRAVDDALGGRDAYGAEVIVRAGGRERLGLIQPGLSYLSSCDPRAHFGLGGAQRADGIKVTWPDGTDEAFDGCAANQVITLHKGQGRKSPGEPSPKNEGQGN